LHFVTHRSASETKDLKQVERLRSAVPWRYKHSGWGDTISAGRDPLV
jgi:hypothetical protein